ncbi:hypothetical protein HBI56_166750 [Parastagonospora nodorum]|uniref:N-acetyltransferase domain-containing protein n=2 Tax=Phaeosphaeria nodorum (strain SN15 / ATCC MYA-4574 / FGSC 10173) TaxID=321614 RepID=A0A7U2IBI0_PHANO|nr:hypothetical protein SNOG_13674 [Parastagonospora nodorum SN15]KAH3915458.1 hypothetical protein HBH56_074510 [Parastagonospora nodorum]EAT79121.1 hypothetical protein SNOG_13674 [Parastagonospora nodorum SN15]KAH3927420.1 hypothetical protein HBH54_154750 [Parastagonospora nodorum]KAH3952075.1 hypothetical protein HBH53_053600 [Parastagonospora nodorum]KAH3981590.1 hypothetical protein HBH51_041500 [Parastagonospora nodorum]
MDVTTTTESAYIVLQIPASSPRIKELVIKFRDTRLAVLQADPGSSLAQYEVESQLPDSIWHGRLAGNTKFLVCVQATDRTLPPEHLLLQGDWAGYAALRERVSVEDYYLVPEQPVPEDPDIEIRWHLYDLYTVPAHRGRNVAKKLVAGCVAVVEGDLGMDDSYKIARLRLYANPSYSWLIKWYERFGFKEGGRVNLRQGFVASAMQDSVPKDTTSTRELWERWERPFAYIMERVFEVA